MNCIYLKYMFKTNRQRHTVCIIPPMYHRVKMCIGTKKLSAVILFSLLQAVRYKAFGCVTHLLQAFTHLS